jgi:hypothetical protein
MKRKMNNLPVLLLLERRKEVSKNSMILLSERKNEDSVCPEVAVDVLFDSIAKKNSSSLASKIVVATSMLMKIEWKKDNYDDVYYVDGAENDEQWFHLHRTHLVFEWSSSGQLLTNRAT